MVSTTPSFNSFVAAVRAHSQAMVFYSFVQGKARRRSSDDHVPRGLGKLLAAQLPQQELHMTGTTMTKQIHLTRRSPAYWRVTFDHPPLNIFGPETIPQLNEVITALETDEQVKVVVFDARLMDFS